MHTFASDGLKFIFGKEPVILSSAIHGKMSTTWCYASQVIFTCVWPTFVNYIGKEMLALTQYWIFFFKNIVKNVLLSLKELWNNGKSVLIRESIQTGTSENLACMLDFRIKRLWITAFKPINVSSGVYVSTYCILINLIFFCLYQ